MSARRIHHHSIHAEVDQSEALAAIAALRAVRYRRNPQATIAAGVALRQAVGATQDELAVAMRTTRETVSRIERRGGVGIYASHTLRVAQAYAEALMSLRRVTGLLGISKARQVRDKAIARDLEQMPESALPTHHLTIFNPEEDTPGD